MCHSIKAMKSVLSRNAVHLFAYLFAYLFVYLFSRLFTNNKRGQQKSGHVIGRYSCFNLLFPVSLVLVMLFYDSGLNC